MNRCELINIACNIRCDQKIGTVAGLTSSLAPVATGVTGLGTGQIGNTAWAGSGAYGGLVVADTDTLVKYTYLGDADLDGSVTFDDYLTWQTNFGSANTNWTSGHFQYDNGIVSFDDYLSWQTNFGLTINDGLGLTAGGSNISAVPEPSTWVLGSLAMLGLAGLRLRRRSAAM